MKKLSTPALTLLSLPYQLDSLQYFHTITSQLPMALLLQSDTPAAANMRGRFDIMTAAPEYWLETHNGQKSWRGTQPPNFLLNDMTSFSALRQLVELIQTPETNYSQCVAEDIPFCGGLIGYCSYDLARETIHLDGNAIPDIDIPDMQFGFYSWACIQDHLKKKSWLIIHSDCNHSLANKLPDLLLKKIGKEETWHKSTSNSTDNNVESDMTLNQYSDKFEKIQDYIHSGDCYQINLAQRFTANTTREPLQLYSELRKVMPSPFCAFLPILGSNDKHAIISLSPERFIQIDNNKNIISQPIKGTAQRNSNPDLDHHSASSLLSDKKNQSENLMIVDLLRNDLGRVCEIGSIKVNKLFELQSFSNVHHLVSTIEGKLTDGLNGADVFQACFPGGSITGAPKIRAMEIIDELEPTTRSIYCGSIIYFSAHGATDSNIMIRTILVRDKRVYCWGGGGIVADSECSSEYNESIAKVSNLLNALKINQKNKQ